MTIPEFTRALEQVVPLSAAGYERDAIGLQVGLDASTDVARVLFAYEVTKEVVVEAKERSANLIVAFHPLIFPTIAAVTNSTRTGALIRELVRSNIALYIQHTAFDTHPAFGTSRRMAEALGLQEIQTLSPLAIQPVVAGGIFGMGAIGTTKSPIEVAHFIEVVQRAFGTPVIRTNEKYAERISRVAVLGGAGMEYYGAARAAGAHAFVTADVRYHDFYRAAHDGILLIDAGHAETERFVTASMVLAGQEALKAMSRQNVVSLQNPGGLEPALSAIPAILEARTKPNAVGYFVMK